MEVSRSASIGPGSRPVSVPDDVDDPRHKKASGIVKLPLHLYWSGPPVSYDLDDPVDRNRLYEVVLREGLDDDVRYYVDPDILAAEWSNLVLPERVRRAWVPWFREHRALQLAC